MLFENPTTQLWPLTVGVMREQRFSDYRPSRGMWVMLCQTVTHETLLCNFSVEFHIQFSCVDHYIYVTFLVWERAKNQEYDMKKTHI